MKFLSALLLVIFIANKSLAQTYEQRLQMIHNREKPRAQDIRYLLHYSDANKTDDELITMLETIKISDAEKRNVSAGTGFPLNRYKLALYMIENGYRIPVNLSSMFSRPFSDNGVKNIMRPSKQQYSLEETKEYMKFFVDKGMRVNYICINRLENLEKWSSLPKLFATELKKYAFELMSDEDLKTYRKLKIETFLRQKKPDFGKIDSILALTDFNFGGNYLANHYIFISASLELVKELRNRGGNINAVNKKGETFLMGVVRRGRPEVLQYLLNDTETNVCTKNKSGETALYYLKKKASSRISKSKSYKSLKKQLKAMECE